MWVADVQQEERLVAECLDIGKLERIERADRRELDRARSFTILLKCLVDGGHTETRKTADEILQPVVF